MKQLLCFSAFFLALIEFCACWDSPTPIITTKANLARRPLCQKHRDAYARAFQNFTLWAVQMYDASAKLPNGILAANNYHLGNFDECLAVNADLGTYNGGVVNGKYCLVKLQLGTEEPHSPPHKSLEFDPFDNVWNKIRPSGEMTIWRRDQIFWGICMPDSCSESDIQKDVDAILRRTWFGERVSATVNPALCQTRETVETKAKSPFLDKFTKNLFLVLISLVLSSTIYDSFADGKSSSRPMEFLRKAFLCFSMRHNVPSLLLPKSYGSGFDAITGARTFLTLLVLYGHRWRMQVVAPISDSLPFEQKARDFNVLTTCLIIINSFFGISGFLLGYFFFSELEKREKNKKLGWGVVITPIIYRFLRFTPLYAVVVLLFMSTLPKLGSGPIWPLNVVPEIENCNESWWTNLLYINNYFKTDSMCMYQSWYLSTDMQLFIIALVMLYVYKKNESLGKRVFGYSIAGCIVWHGVQLYLRDDPAYMIVDEQRMRKVPHEYYYITYYIPTHFRLPSYMIGVLAGIYSWKTKDTPTKLSLRQLNFCSLFLLVTALSVQVLGHVFTAPSSIRDNTFARAIYGCLHGSIWATCTVAGIALTLKREGGVFQWFFTLTPFIFLSKLSFGAYLLHSVAQSVEFGSLRTPKTPSVHEEYWMTAGDIIFVHFFSFLLCVLVEVPFSRLQKLILIGDRNQGEKDCSQTEAKKVE